MSWLSRIIDVIREPVDQIKNLICEQDVHSQTCGNLSDLSSMMGGTHTQNLILQLDEFVREAFTEARNRGTPTMNQRITLHKAPPLDFLKQRSGQ